MIKYVTDSSCDTHSLGNIQVNVVPLRIYTDEREFIDTEDMDVHEMLDYLLNFSGRSYTACPSTQSWLEAYEGGDEIYVITMTSHLSGTYNSACAARDIYLESHPNAKICVIDTLSTGPEMRLILEKIIEWKHANIPFEDISKKVKEYMSSTRLFFSFKSLHNFAQNGRINKVIASLIGKLNISIIGTASSDGVVEPTAKCRGVKNIIQKLVNEITRSGFLGGKIRICHIENESLAHELGETLKSHFPYLDLQIYPARGLCSYYGERGGIIIGCECS